MTGVIAKVQQFLLILTTEAIIVIFKYDLFNR